MVAVSLSGVSKSFGAVRVFDGLGLEVASKSYVCLLGPSGCGKSTLMRIISGLDSGDRGEVRFDGRVVNDLTSAERDVGMAFQNYALYPHLTVEGNLRFPLRAPIQKGRWTDAEMVARVAEIADLLQITPLLQRSIDQLSGGQQQRVSLGRALIRHPRVLLLDEPVTHLDARLRYAMRSELRRIHEVMGTTTFHVTHDQQEALALADLLVIMRQGRIEQAAPAMVVYTDPATSFVAEFLGDPPRSVVEVGLTERDGRVAARLGDAELALPDKLQSGARSLRAGRACLALPAHAVSACVPDGGGEDREAAVLVGKVRAHEMVEGAQRIVLDCAGQQFQLRHSDQAHVAIGDAFTIRVDARDAMLFDAETGKRRR